LNRKDGGDDVSAATDGDCAGGDDDGYDHPDPADGVEVAGIRWLAETRHRPVRPNLPWLRNLSWVKLHALQLGVGVGVFVAFAVAFGFPGAVVGVAYMVGDFVFARRRQYNPDSPCNHGIGAHDIKEKPWYFLTSLFATQVVYVAVSAGL
jgi:hypothetical protein